MLCKTRAQYCGQMPFRFPEDLQRMRGCNMSKYTTVIFLKDNTCIEAGLNWVLT